MAALNVQEVLADVTDHLRGMWRYRWIAVFISWVAAVCGWFMVYSMPNIYRASAQVSVNTNSLLPALTAGLTARENLMSEVDLVSKALLTRPNLEAVARATDLDLRADTPQEMEALITGLQRRVKVAGGRDKIFNISYADPDRNKARRCCSVRYTNGLGNRTDRSPRRGQWGTDHCLTPWVCGTCCPTRPRP